MEQQIGGLVRRRPRIGTRPIQHREHIGRGRKRTDTLSDHLHLRALITDFGSIAEALGTKSLKIGSVDRHRIGYCK
jgi:hypothetical protein